MKQKKLVILLMVVLIFSFSSQVIAKKTEEEKLAKMEKKIEKILGTNTSWKPTVFKDLRLNMSCKNTRKYFKGIKCASHKKYSFPKVGGKLFGTVKEYQFTFKYGKLQSAKIFFGARVFDQKRFYIALMRVAQRKWGKLPKEKLAKKYKYWYNGDRDRVSINYFKNSFIVDVSMPKRDTGNVTAGSMTSKEIAKEMVKLLGSSKYWNVPALSKFKKGMTCDDVLKIYSSMKGCKPYKKYSRGTVTIQNHKLIHALYLSFRSGKLHSTSLIFHRQLPKEITKVISLVVFEKKWGKIKADKRKKDYISKYKRGFGFVRRSWMRDHWEISFDFPK